MMVVAIFVVSVVVVMVAVLVAFVAVLVAFVAVFAAAVVVTILTVILAMVAEWVTGPTKPSTADCGSARSISCISSVPCMRVDKRMSTKWRDSTRTRKDADECCFTLHRPAISFSALAGIGVPIVVGTPTPPFRVEYWKTAERVARRSTSSIASVVCI